MYKTFIYCFSVEILIQSVVISAISGSFVYFYIGGMSAALFYGALTFVLMQVGALAGAIYIVWSRPHDND